MTQKKQLSTAQRYLRALRLTAPKGAAATPGVAVEGYWLDRNSFYFLTERVEPSLGRLVPVPSIAHCEIASVEEVMSLDTLAHLLCGHSGQLVELEALSCAEFDMLDCNTLAVLVGGREFLVDPREPCVIQARESLEVPALYSPDGRHACFVKDHDLWLKDLKGGSERPLTTDGAAHHCYGQQTEACSWPVTYRNRPDPMGLWSPDSKWFLTHRIDERALAEIALIQHAPPGGGRPALHTYKHPIPGDALPTATYVAIHIESDRKVSFEGCAAPVLRWSPFLFLNAWFSESDTAWFLRTDRYFKQAELIRLDLAQGTCRTVLSETVSSGYLEFHHCLGGTPNVRTLVGSDEIIWFSEADGWGHLYLYDARTGDLKNRITSGDWMVRDIVHVDEAQRRFLFTACGVDPQADPARRSLCSIGLDGSGFEVLIAHDGDISLPKTETCGLPQNRPFRSQRAQPGVSPNGRFAAVLYSSIDRGNVTRIVDLHERRGFDIASARPAAGEVPPRQFTALAADGVTTLHGALFVPSEFDENRRYPLIDYIYPGPQIGQKPQSFYSLKSGQAKALAELGFVTVMFDTRGMPFRSRALHQIGYGELLQPQLADHAAVVRQLCERYAFIDADRIGMIGQSGGGFATARALFDYGSLFKVGVSVCGNHDNRFHIAFWSDKYRGPLSAAKAAAQASAAAAHKLSGRLLLITGDMDENVHPSHTLVLVDALIRANRDFDLLIVPNAGHDVLNSIGYVQRRVWDYFVRNLLREIPPPQFEIRYEPHELASAAKKSMQEILR